MSKDKHIPQGYKESSLGIIPKEWEVKRLGEVCKRITDGTHGTPQKQTVGVPYLTAIHIKDGAIDYNSCYYLTKEDHKEIYKRCNPEYGDVLMVNIGAGVGSVAMNIVDYEFSLKNVALLKPTKEILKGYYLESYLLMAKKRNIYKLLNGGAQPFWGLDDITKIPIALPPLEEQERLCSILQLWDVAIEKQSELIEELTLRKRALMQKLLTGKKRLPGFSEKWQEKRLGEIGMFLSNNTLSREQLNASNGDVYCIHYGDVLIKYPSIIDCEKEIMPFINENAYKESMTDFLENGDIIISDTAEDETVGKACEIQNVGNKKILAGLHTMLLRPNKGLFAPCFLGYYINSEAYHKKLIPLIQGIKVCSIGKMAIQNTLITIPNVKEQNAIASVLVKADKEIELANEKLAKLQSQKRGLMQQLLTGKKRIE